MALAAAVGLGIYAPPSAAANLGGYNVGVGAGRSTTTGDFVQRRSLTVFELGFDIESPSQLFVFTGQGDTDKRDEASAMTLLLGGGWPAFKLATGFITQDTSLPTVTPDPSLIVTTDPARLTKLSVTTIPIFARLHPILTERFVFTLEGYYGLYARGDMEVPVKAGGYDAVMETEYKRAGGTYGYGATALWRIGQGLSLRLAYRMGHARMDRTSTTFKGDVFGTYAGTTIPETEFRNRMLLLSLAFGF